MRITAPRTLLYIATSVLAVSIGAVATTGPGTATAAPTRVDTKFSIAVIPDTQLEVLSSDDQRFVGRTEWIASKRRELDVRFVTHIGDVVNWGWLDPSQYAIADQAFDVLDRARIPYVVSVGNHDTRAADIGGGAYADNPECVTRFSADECHFIPLLRHTEEFDAAFPVSRMRAVRGTFEPGKAGNSFSTFAAGGVDWLVLNLEPWPRLEVVEWAKGVVAAHLRHNVIVQTHNYLNDDGSIYSFESIAPLTSPQYLYDNLIRRYPNIRIVLSGHTGQGASRVDTGDAGNRVVSLLNAFHSQTTNPLRLMEIDTATNSLRTWIQAPHTNQTSAATTFSGLAFVAP